MTPVGPQVTGAGVERLVEVVTTLLPGPAGDATAPFEGRVFAVGRPTGGVRVCSVRIDAGSLAVRDQVQLSGGGLDTVTALALHRPGGPVPVERAGAGRLVRVQGLDQARTGNRLGAGGSAPPAPPVFPAPGLEVSVTARDPRRSATLHAVLTVLADGDPLIRVRPDRRPGALRISVYGAVQQEVVAETLAVEHGLEVDFGPRTVRYVERPARRAEEVLLRGEHGLALTLGLEVAPAAPGSGVSLTLDVERAGLPLHVYGTP